MTRLLAIALGLLSTQVSADLGKAPNDSTIEKSIQLTIMGSDYIQKDNKNWGLWKSSDLSKFPDDINTYVIHPVSKDNTKVSYGDCTTTCTGATLEYIKRVKLQIDEIESDKRIYVGVPHAVEAKYVPTRKEIQNFFKKLSETVYLPKIEGIYLTDEIYYGFINKSPKYFNYFRMLKSVMKEYNYLDDMPLLWMPRFKDQRNDADQDGNPDNKLSDLLRWQKENQYTIIDRMVIQTGFYNQTQPTGVGEGNKADIALAHMKIWIENQAIDGVKAGNTKIGAMIEVNAAVDWCATPAQLKTANDIWRRNYALNHNSFISLSDYYDINYFLDYNSPEWDMHTLDAEITYEYGKNPYGLVKMFFKKHSILMHDNQSDFNQQNTCPSY